MLSTRGVKPEALTGAKAASAAAPEGGLTMALLAYADELEDLRAAIRESAARATSVRDLEDQGWTALNSQLSYLGLPARGPTAVLAQRLYDSTRPPAVEAAEEEDESEKEKEEERPAAWWKAARASTIIEAEQGRAVNGGRRRLPCAPRHLAGC